MGSLRSNLGTGRSHTLFVVPSTQRCFELPGPHFDFDKALVRPDGLDALKPAHAALAENPTRTAIIFGHTDTVGTEDYNKLLSERRGRAVLGVLTQDPAIWEKLWSEESWGTHALQVMLNRVGATTTAIDEDGQPGPPTTDSVKAFQSRADHPPLNPDGIAGPATRHELFLAYFKTVSDDPLDATRFRDFGGGRIAGCSEFNPFTPNNVPDENSRRVVVIVFNKGSEPGALPCKVGDISACRPNLRADGEPPPDPRNPFFRCKVFAKIASKCPGTKPSKPGLGTWEVPPTDTPPGETVDFPDADWETNATVTPADGEVHPPDGMLLVSLVDDAGAPMANVTLSTPGGVGGTDAGGVAVLPGDAGATVKLEDLSAVWRVQPVVAGRPVAPRDATIWATAKQLVAGVVVPARETTVTFSTRVVFALSANDADVARLLVRDKTTKAAVTDSVTRSPTGLRLDAQARGEGTVLEVYLPAAGDEAEQVVATLDLDALAAGQESPAAPAS